MNKNKRWGIEPTNTDPVHVVLFISRKKDNKHIEGFTERRESFITTWKNNDPRLDNRFVAFCDNGYDNEVCRFYYSVNARDPELVRRELMKFLIDNPDFNLCSIESKLAGIAATAACATEKKWLFDFDVNSVDACVDFMSDVIQYSGLTANDVKAYKTPNGFAVVVERGFDTRELMKKWQGKVELKRDDVLLIMWKDYDPVHPYHVSTMPETWTEDVFK